MPFTVWDTGVTEVNKKHRTPDLRELLLQWEKTDNKHTKNNNSSNKENWTENMEVTGNSEGRTHLDGIVNDSIWKVPFDLI